jgi:hypothetical protein
MKQLLTALLLILAFYGVGYKAYHAGEGDGFGRGKLKGFTYGVWYARGDSAIITFTGEKNWLLDNLYKEDSAMEVYNKTKNQQ